MPPTVTVSELADALQQSTLNGRPEFQFIDSPESLASMLDALTELPMDPPSLYVDLEGVNLLRHGTILILQLYVLPNDFTYLIDIYSLGGKAFDTAGAGGHTLQTILELSAVFKAFFDV